MKARTVGETVRPRPLLPKGWALFRFQRFDHDKLAHLTAVFEDNFAGDLGEKSIVFASANVEAWLHASAALAHNNCPAGDNLSAECLEAQPLRVGVAPVS